MLIFAWMARTDCSSENNRPESYYFNFSLFQFLNQIASGCDSSCLFRSFLTVVSTNVKNFTPTNLRLQLVHNMAKFPGHYFVSKYLISFTYRT